MRQPRCPGKDIAKRKIARVGVIGAGTMGGGIAMAFANGGYPVTLLETSDEALQRGLATIDKNYAVSVTRGSLTEDARQQRLALFNGSTDYADLADCDLIIEAVFEDMAVKQEVFGKLDAVAKPGAILATNTSYLDVNDIAASTSRPQDVLGLHFFSPANVMKLLEIVRADKTAPDALATVVDLARRIGKVPVVVGVCHGFVGNRMLAARGAESEALLLEGATPQPDRQGVHRFRLADGAVPDGRSRRPRHRLAQPQGARPDGGDRRHAVRTGAFRPEDRQRLLSLRGRRAHAGRRSGGRSADPRQGGREGHRAAHDRRRRDHRAHALSAGQRGREDPRGEGIAARASDIDVVWVNGYGFPVGKGGPMFWAGDSGWPRSSSGSSIGTSGPARRCTTPR